MRRRIAGPLLARRVAVVDRLAQRRAAAAARACAPGPGRAPWSGRGRAPGACGRARSPSSTGRLKARLLPEAVPLVTTRFRARRRLAAPRAGASRAHSIPAARERLDAGPGASERGSATGSAARARLRGSRRRSARRGGAGSIAPSQPADAATPSHRASHGRRRGSAPRPRRSIAAATRSASRALRSWMRRMSAPSRTARATAATVPHSRSPAAQPLLPRAGEHRADEVLARERRRRAAARASAARRGGAGSRRSCSVVRSKSRPGSIAICSSATPSSRTALRLAPRTRPPGGRRRRRTRAGPRSTRGGPSMCIST